MKSSLNLTRRRFLKKSGRTTVALSALLGSKQASIRGSASSVVETHDGGGDAQVLVHDGKVKVKSKTLTAVLDRGLLTSLRNRATGEELIRTSGPAENSALSLLYRSSETLPMGEEKFGTITTRQVSENRAEVTVHHWDGDGVIRIAVDRATGDLIVEPSAYSSRPGMRACRWNLAGIREDLQLVAPFYQGVRLKLDDPLIQNTRWEWPKGWEASLAILQSSRGGFWIHTQDDRYRYKALQVGSERSPFSLGLDTEAYGPLDNNFAAGGLAWRINVFEGNWQIPATRYRDWLWKAYNLDRAMQSRQAWIHQVTLAVSWCPTELGVLDALSKKVDPKRVLLHFPHWRSDPYDENYPDYVASAAAKKFLDRGKELGFRVMPHFNSIDMDPVHPVYPLVRDFEYRRVDDQTLWGWSWVDGRPIGVPESNYTRKQHRSHKVMVKIHPGLSLWRSILAKRIQKAIMEQDLETVFLDVTLNTGNLHNCLVENMTSSEGMNRLIHEIGELGVDLVVGGEGLNETTFSGISFGQVHLFRSSGGSISGLSRTGGCDLNNFLFGKVTRTFGYSRLSGQTEDDRLRMQLHDDHGAIPTITIDSAEEIANPNPALKKVLSQAAG